MENAELKRIIQINKVLDGYSIVAITDKYGTITYANDEFCKISKYSREELIGQNHRILKSGFHSPEFYKNLWDTISAGLTWRGILKNKAKDGTYYWVQTMIVPFPDDAGHPVEYVAIRTDITEQVRLHQDLKGVTDKIIRSEKFSVIGAITASFAHEVRTPLATIQGTVDMLKDEFLKEGNQKRISQCERIIRSIEKISSELERILDFVRTRPLELKSNSLLHILQSVLNDVKIPNTIKMKIPDHDMEIICDYSKIETVFRNLIKNAMEAIVEKGEIDIKFTELEDEARVEFRDSGSGISSDVIQNLFEPLFTTKTNGTGLGLASCKTIIEQHDGIIMVESKPGNGTLFLIRIPKAGKHLSNI